MSKANQGGPAGQGSDSEVLRALIDCRALIARGWCQGHAALGSDDHPIWWGDGRATSWCMDGATCKATGVTANERPTPLYFRVAKLLEEAAGVDYVEWQDALGRTQAEVLAAFDKAIALASNASAAESRPQEDPQP